MKKQSIQSRLEMLAVLLGHVALAGYAAAVLVQGFAGIAA